MDPQNKAAKVFIWLVQLVMAWILFKAAVMKFDTNPQVIRMFDEIGMEPHGRIIIGILEFLAAVLLLIPHGIVYGAFLGLGIMTGAIIGHFTDIGIEGLHMALVVFLGCLIIIYVRRRESSIFRNMFDQK